MPGGLEPDTDEEEDDINNEASGQTDSKNKSTDVNLLISQMDLVITGSADATAKVWSLYSGECYHVSKWQVPIYWFLKVVQCNMKTFW